MRDARLKPPRYAYLAVNYDTPKHRGTEKCQGLTSVPLCLGVVVIISWPVWGLRSREIRDFPCRAGQLEDVHARVGAIDDVDVAAIVDFDVVGLDRGLAPLLTTLPAAADATLVRLRRDRRN